VSLFHSFVEDLPDDCHAKDETCRSQIVKWQMFVKLCTCWFKCRTISMLQAIWKVLNLVSSVVHLKTMYCLTERKFQLRLMQIYNTGSERMPWFLQVQLLPVALCSPNRLFVCFFVCICLFMSVCLFACLFLWPFGTLNSWNIRQCDSSNNNL